ncbi:MULTISPECIES: hypothetical protein [Rhizobium]|uniref:hypothetical protein n=1 Tax=Rhizobium TaxID=379 RepID=UPI00103C5267|nr:hypothetical protein [Rhizobium leguminosarum]TBZ99697.1 hypothetical protein E0H57_27985 [Rhizobium leguminosarum bv. viciae]UFW76289.1 hypothetical protein RlegSU303_13465 [Rhizobium leguminosarum bv. viciae]
MDREIDVVVNNRNDDRESAKDRINCGFILTTINGDKIGPFNAQKDAKAHSISKSRIKIPDKKYNCVEFFWHNAGEKVGYFQSFPKDSKYDGLTWTAIYIDFSSLKLGKTIYEQVSGGLANSSASVEI